jgi:hypothetical protein
VLDGKEKIRSNKRNGVRTGCIKNPVGKKLPACGAKLQLQGGDVLLRKLGAFLEF